MPNVFFGTTFPWGAPVLEPGKRSGTGPQVLGPGKRSGTGPPSWDQGIGVWEPCDLVRGGSFKNSEPEGLNLGQWATGPGTLGPAPDRSPCPRSSLGVVSQEHGQFRPS